MGLERTPKLAEDTRFGASDMVLLWGGPTVMPPIMEW